MFTGNALHEFIISGVKTFYTVQDYGTGGRTHVNLFLVIVAVPSVVAKLLAIARLDASCPSALAEASLRTTK